MSPLDLATLWRLLTEHADALREDHDSMQALADTYLAGTCDLAVEARCDAAGARKIKAERALATFTDTVRATATSPPAAEGMGEFDSALLTVEMASENVALDNGRSSIRRRDEAHDHLLMLVRSALAARDERIAALEAGLREACDLLAAVTDAARFCDTGDGEGIHHAKVDDPRGGPARYLTHAIVTDEPRLRALADAGKAGA